MKFIILAGGNGSRLFPLSRDKAAKQFLKLTSEYSLMQETVLRFKSNDFVIVGGKKDYYKIKTQLEEINLFAKNRVLSEPFGRNTAPAITYALKMFDDNDVLAVLPSDHYIKDEQRFLDTLAVAEETARKGFIVTLGITPSYPETGYGYIEAGEVMNENVYKIKAFKEKPDLDTAKDYLESGNFFWNAGMFIFKKATFLEQLKKYSSNIYEFYEEITSTDDIEEFYENVENISIDYALMEKTDKGAVIKSDFGWSDIGNWKALKDIIDDNGNVEKAEKFIPIDSNNNIVVSDKPVVGAINVDNLAIIDTKDILLVADLNNAQKVKDFYNAVKEYEPARTIAHPDEERPWGMFASLKDADGFKVKWIKVKKGEQLSLQYHHQREEHWIIVKGRAIMTLGEKQFEVKPGDYIHIPIKELHTIEGIEDTEFIEVQRGDYLGEDDIVRVKDRYNR